MAEINYHFCWPKPDQDEKDQAIAFWHENNAFQSADTAAQRADNLLCLARSNDGTIMAVSTVILRQIAQLEADYFVYRTFAAPSARLAAISLTMLNRAFEHLQASSKQNGLGSGVYLEVENPALMRHQNEGIWFESRFVYIGTSPQGWHKRVRHFLHSKRDQDHIDIV